MRAILFLLLLCTSVFADNIEYTLTIEEPQNHICRVEIRAMTDGEDSLEFSLPAWSPGRYVIYNFSKNVFDVQAHSESGRTLPVSVQDKQTWLVRTENSKTVIFNYRVFAHTPDGTFSNIDSDGASINGAGIFMYLRGRKDLSVGLTAKFPQSWQTVCPLPQDSVNHWQAANYDILIDSPIEAGKLYIHSFKHQGREHLLVFHRQIKRQILTTFENDIKKIITAQNDIFKQPLPYKRYVFFFRLDTTLIHSDGMEHLNSCRVLLRIDPDNMQTDANRDDAYDNLIWLTAHEYFHLWNVKRLRPAGLGPFDYSREVYTPSLWIAEGLTSYYAYLALVRSGIYTTDKLLSEFSGRITRYEIHPAKMLRSLEEVSLLSWLFKGKIPSYEETNAHKTFYSYYYKGLIVGMLLDLTIRRATENRLSLDDVMRAMYEQFYLRTPVNYYLSGRGYKEADFERLAGKTAGIDLTLFFDTAVHRTETLDYTILEFVGLELKYAAEEKRYRLEHLKQLSAEQKAALESWLGN